MPKKTLVRSTEVWELANRLGEFGVGVSDPKLFWNKVLDRKESLVKGLQGDKEAALKERGIELIRGQAVFTSPTTVKVGDHTIEASKFVSDWVLKTPNRLLKGWSIQSIVQTR
jgi:dihydrolipoamide dehydrogenase